MTGDGPQSQPGINIMTNSSASSTPVTATNPSNIPTNIHASGEISSLSRDADVQNSGIETLPGKAEASEGCPPPIPNKHEGKPSSTWTPPFVGSAGNTSQVGVMEKVDECNVIVKRQKITVSNPFYYTTTTLICFCYEKKCFFTLKAVSMISRHLNHIETLNKIFNIFQTNTNTQGPPPHLGQDQSSSVTVSLSY